MEAGQIKTVIERALVSFTGQTTANGNVGGTTLVCSALTTRPDFDGQKVIIADGTYAGQVRDIDGATTAGTVTVTPAFGGQILLGVNFYITTELPMTEEAALITARIGDPSAHTLTNLVAKWGDLARSLDIILGARWDSSGDLGTDIASLLASALLHTGLAYAGTVATVPVANSFTATELTGFGNGQFAGTNPYRVFVLRDADGVGAAPQGETRPITSYTSATGLFAHSAFTVALVAGDKILVIHPRLAEILDLITRLGNPDAHTLTSITTKIGNLARDLTTILGTKWDAAGDVGTDILALLTNLGAVGDTATADDLSDIATTSAHAKLRRLLLRFSADAFAATIQGSSRTDLETMLAQLATYFAASGAAYASMVNPGGSERTNIEQVLEDIGDMLAGAGITTYPGPAAPGNGVSIAEVVHQIYDDVIAIAAANVLHEQADVAISDVAPIAPLVFNILNLATASTRYVVRSLRIKTVDPGANTITVRLYELVNNALTEVDSFVITTANYGTYHSLMDMFGLPQLVGDNLKVTIEASAVGYAVLAQYTSATASI